MGLRKLVLVVFLSWICAPFTGAPSAAADTSHARIIRLSLVQGDVRFAREIHGDPLTDSNAIWETAILNLPIRQGYVIATDNGRTEVEFENGAMAFLKENTVLEFYDLSLRDGDRTTRLILRQGSASFYVNPAGGDYFSVTGGDFTAEATSRASFRLDNYDDGSTVEDLKGNLSVVYKGKTTDLAKGQFLSIKAGDDSSLAVGTLPDQDDFDRWVSGRVDSASTATNAALQYTNSSNYVPGFGDLYTYGSFFNCGAYGYGWRPFGAGLGWSPFSQGQWFWDPGFGWSWMSYQPWGWAPYHYGGWLFDNSCGGWFYSPPVFFGYPGAFGPGRKFPPVIHPPRPLYRPVTAVFVRNNGQIGIVPMHPLDQKGKTPQNLEHGAFSAGGAKGLGEPILGSGQKWETLKSAPREALSGSLAAASAPTRVSRTLLEGRSGPRAIVHGNDSSIAYDPREHRFVNTNAAAASSNSTKQAKESASINAQASAGTSRAGVLSTKAAPPAATTSSSSRSSAPPRRNMTPPPAPRYSSGASGSSSSGGRSFGGSSSGRASAPAPASHASSGRPH